MRFEWNVHKAEVNRRKHGVSFKEASTVFGDPLSITVLDPHPSKLEDRFVTLGLSGRFKTIVVVHADEADTVRIISARRATRKERRMYEQGVQ